MPRPSRRELLDAAVRGGLVPALESLLADAVEQYADLDAPRPAALLRFLCDAAAAGFLGMPLTDGESATHGQRLARLPSIAPGDSEFTSSVQILLRSPKLHASVIDGFRSRDWHLRCAKNPGRMPESQPADDLRPIAIDDAIALLTSPLLDLDACEALALTVIDAGSFQPRSKVHHNVSPSSEARLRSERRDWYHTLRASLAPGSASRAELVWCALLRRSDLQEHDRVRVIGRWLALDPIAVGLLLQTRSELRLSPSERRCLTERLSQQAIVCIQDDEAGGVRAAHQALAACPEYPSNGEEIVCALVAALGACGESDKRQACLEFLEFLSLREAVRHV